MPSHARGHAGGASRPFSGAWGCPWRTTRGGLTFTPAAPHRAPRWWHESPYKLCGTDASVKGGLGVILPGSVVHPGMAMIVVHVPGATEGEPVQRAANADDAGVVAMPRHATTTAGGGACPLTVSSSPAGTRGPGEDAACQRTCS